MFSYYKELLTTGIHSTASSISRVGPHFLHPGFSNTTLGLIELDPKLYPPKKSGPDSIYAYVRNASPEDKFVPVEIFFADDDSEDDGLPVIIEDAEICDENYEPPEELPEEDIGTTEIMGVPIPRSRPVPIRRPVIEGWNYNDSEEYRYLKIDLFNIHKNHEEVYKEFNQKADGLTGKELLGACAPISVEGGTTIFYFDNETVTLLTEKDFMTYYLKAEPRSERRWRSVVKQLRKYGAENAMDMDPSNFHDCIPIRPSKNWLRLQILQFARQQAHAHDVTLLDCEFSRGEHACINRLNNYIRFFIEDDPSELYYDYYFGSPDDDGTPLDLETLMIRTFG